MNEVELESMVVRLLGDGSSFGQMMRGAADDSRAAASEVEGYASKVEGFSKRLGSVMTGILAGLGAMGASHWLREAFGAWSEAEDVMISLRATLRANERDVEGLSNRYQAFASDMQELTTISDEATLSSLRMAESFNLTGDAAERAVRSAIGLGRAAGSSTDAMLRMTTAMEQGDIKRAMMFSRMVPQLRGVKDEQEFILKYNRLVASGFDAIKESANTAAGQLRALKESYGDLMEEFGKIVAQGIRPFVEGVRTTVKWVQELPPWLKQATVASAALVAGILAIASAMAVVAFIFNSSFFGVGLIVGGIVAGTVALVSWISTLQVAADAWTWMKAKAVAFWLWIRPVVRAGIGYASAAWDLLKQAAVFVWDTIKSAALGVWAVVTSVWGQLTAFFGEIFSALGIEGGVTFNDIKDFAIEGFIAAEFATRNFARVFNWAMVGIQLGWEIVKGEFIHFFGVTMPALLNWFGRNWQSVFTDAFNFVTTGFMNLLGNVATIGQNLPLLLAGQMSAQDLANLWVPLGQGFRATMEALPAMAGRQAGVLEQQLREEFAALGDGLLMDWAAFRQRRLAEINAEDVDRAERAGEQVGRSFNRGVEQEVHRFDSVLRYSREFLYRLEEYTDMLARRTGTGSGGAGGMSTFSPAGAAGTAANAVAAVGGAGGQAANLGRVEEILGRIATNTARPPIQVQGVGL